ncbi:hypothetical protein KUTeg_022839 [Tegillarca granosa]|uniref:Protein XRP2 n=1 Tax=Tegillarca granosa TaxID=220873 RepID=A0ABQ9E0E0_TEGGR|nr:hypothetical protein KUTeg_022839 [Tegillarca granosa]
MIMGCLFAKLGIFRTHQELEEEPPKQYSWDKRRKEVNIQDFMLDGHKDATIGRMPGEVNGQQFMIQNCENCNIYIYDHINTISVDDCVNCNIFLGPIKTSVFIRDCKNCNFVLACQQFRTRDCNKLDVFLFCGTQPIIESTSGVRLACYQYYYPQLADQFQQAGLSIYNNTWSTVHDFTQDPDVTHFSLLPEDAKVEDFVPRPLAEQFASLDISTEPSKSVIPLTHGTRRKTSDESCLLVFFNDGVSFDRVQSFLQTFKTEHPECVLVQTKEVIMQPADAQRVFGTDSYAMVVQQGPVIGLEINGDGCIQHCQEVMVNLMKGTTGLVFVSQSVESAAKQLDDFYNFAELMMSI